MWLYNYRIGMALYKFGELMEICDFEITAKYTMCVHVQYSYVINMQLLFMINNHIFNKFPISSAYVRTIQVLNLVS